VVGTLLLAWVIGAGDAIAIEARHSGASPGCTGATDPETYQRAVEKLGDERTQRAGLRLLRRQGDEGCQAIMDWIRDGLPDVRDEVRREAIFTVGRSDSPGALELTLQLAQLDDEEFHLPALDALQERLVVLTPQEAMPLVRSPHSKVRKRMVAILIGVHANVEVELDGYGVDVSDSDFWSADFPAVHDPQLALLVADESSAVREHMASSIGRFWTGGYESPRTFDQHIQYLLMDNKEDVRTQAAEAIGIGCPPSGLELVDFVLGLDSDDAVDSLVDGLEDRIEDADPNTMCAEMARKVAQEGPWSHRAEAAALAHSARRQSR